MLPCWWIAAIKLFFGILSCTTWVAGSLIEIIDCQEVWALSVDVADFSSSSPLLCGVWRSGELRQPFSKADSILFFEAQKVGYESWDAVRAFTYRLRSAVQLRKKNVFHETVRVCRFLCHFCQKVLLWLKHETLRASIYFFHITLIISAHLLPNLLSWLSLNLLFTFLSIKNTQNSADSLKSNLRFRFD